jgi:hypothetical protein
MTRGTTNKNQTGSAANRRARKLWLLSEFGDGATALCSFGCGTVLTFTTMTVDRYPLGGNAGGTYRRGNIRPACGPCNSSHGSNEMHARLGHKLKGKK